MAECSQNQEHTPNRLGAVTKKKEHAKEDEVGFERPRKKTSAKFSASNCDKELHEDKSFRRNRFSIFEAVELGRETSYDQGRRKMRTSEPRNRETATVKYEEVSHKPARMTTKSRVTNHVVGILTRGRDASVAVCGKSAGTETAAWRRIAIAIDSGACDNVISPEDVPEQEVVESVESRKGEQFYSATGEPIPNLGDIKLPMVTLEGTSRGMLMKFAPVSKSLGFVKRICKVGHTVVFDDEGSFILNKRTGEDNWLREEEGNYMLDAWIPPPDVKPMNSSEGFCRLP